MKQCLQQLGCWTVKIIIWASRVIQEVRAIRVARVIPVIRAGLDGNPGAALLASSPLLLRSRSGARRSTLVSRTRPYCRRCCDD